MNLRLPALPAARSPATAVATIVVLESPNHSLAIDPNAIGRVVQGILTGIGFLGAGVILRDPKGHITGLTTAATIWICAVLGIVCGLWCWSILAIALGLTAFALLLGQRVERLVERLFKRHQSGPTDNSVLDLDGRVAQVGFESCFIKRKAGKGLP